MLPRVLRVVAAVAVCVPVVSALELLFVQNVAHVLGDILLLTHHGVDVGRYNFTRKVAAI